MDRIVPLALIMVMIWVAMLLLFIVIQRLIAPIPALPPYLGGAFATGLIKAVLSFSLALAWLYLWHTLVQVYRRRSLRNRA